MLWPDYLGPYATSGHNCPDAVLGFVSAWTGISNGQWANHQRAKQDVGPHNATYGGTTIRIDSDRVYRAVRTYPANATEQVICQAPGSAIFSTHLWDKLADGSYVSDYYLGTPSKTSYSSPLPRCAYPYQATATGGLRVRNGPGWSSRVSGRLPYGAAAWVVCQQAGSLDGTTPVWDELPDSRWAPDYRLATPSKTRYSGPAPHCNPPRG
jgi:hypothetical protein